MTPRPAPLRHTSLVHFAAVLWACASATACVEDDLGAPCGDPAVVGEFVAVEPGRTDVVQSVRFECDSAICMSLRGSEPFCTRECDVDVDCRAGWHCETAVFAAPDAGPSTAAKLCAPAG